MITIFQSVIWISCFMFAVWMATIVAWHRLSPNSSRYSFSFQNDTMNMCFIRDEIKNNVFVCFSNNNNYQNLWKKNATLKCNKTRDKWKLYGIYTCSQVFFYNLPFYGGFGCIYCMRPPKLDSVRHVYFVYFWYLVIYQTD